MISPFKITLTILSIVLKNRGSCKKKGPSEPRKAYRQNDLPRKYLFPQRIPDPLRRIQGMRKKPLYVNKTLTIAGSNAIINFV